MRLFQGKKEAEKILSDLARKIKNKKIRPGLAVILVGKDPASLLYIKLKSKAAKRVGINFFLFKFSARASQQNIIKKIKELNEKKNIQAILVQLPLPKKYQTNKTVKTISPEKDADRGVLPAAIYFALKRGLKKTKRKKIVALVNSDFFGKTLKKFLSQKGVKMSYVLRKDFSPSKIKKADAVISVCGCHKLIKGDMIKKGVVLIDAGIPADVDRESVKHKASFLTPVPGGTGPLTVALLLKNVYKNHTYGTS